MSFILCLVSKLYPQRGEKCQVQNRLIYPHSLVSVFSSGAILWNKIQRKKSAWVSHMKLRKGMQHSEAGLQTTQGITLCLWPVHLCGLFPGVTCSLSSRGFFLTLHCLRAVCSHFVVPKALCSLKYFDLGFFFFFNLSEHPSSGGQQWEPFFECLFPHRWCPAFMYFLWKVVLLVQRHLLAFPQVWLFPPAL